MYIYQEESKEFVNVRDKDKQKVELVHKPLNPGGDF